MTALAAASAAAARLAEARSTLPPGALDLACHAAVPVAVDPTLLNLLRTNFFLDPPDELPWTVEADLLGSPLFRELGGDLYEFEPDLRRHLLLSLGTRYGVDRAVQVALLLERYCDRPGVWGGQPLLLHAQQLTALSIIDPPAAFRWLDEAGAGTSAPVQLSPDWFVAMRGRLAARPDPALRVADEIEAALARLRAGNTDVLSLLGELALLPGADVAPIRAALRDTADDVAAPLLRLLARVQPVDASTDRTDQRVPLHLLLDLDLAPSPWMSAPVGTVAGQPVYLPLNTDQHVVTAVFSTERARTDTLRTIALAFACTYRPSEVNLVLLDTTGDRVFDDLHVLPHVVAAVTDLSRQEDRRRLHRAIRSRAGSPAAKPKCITLAVGSDAVETAYLYADTNDIPRGAVTTITVRLDEPHAPFANLVTQTHDRQHATQMLPATTAVAYDERRTVADMLIERAVARHPDRQPPIWVPARANPPTLDELLARLPADGRAFGVVGGVDDESRRDYEPLTVDLDDGNVAIVGRIFSGKGTILSSLVLSFARRRRPDQLEFFIVGPANPLADLAGLPHVAQYAPRPDADLIARVRRAMQARRLASGPSTVLVVNDVPDLLPLVEEIRRSGPTSSIRVLVSATSWDSLGRFEIELETTFDDPPNSRIDPEQYVDPVRSMSHGLAPGGVPFVIPLIDHVEQLVSRIAASWTGPTARDRWAGIDAGQQPPPRPVSTGRRIAVVIGTSTYADSELPPLPGAVADVSAIAEVLRDPSIGNYDVTVLLDRDERTIRQTLDDVLTGSGPDDQVLVYVTGHGMLEPRGHLYLATTDTRRDRLLATAIDSQWIMDLLDHSRARQQVLLIDTCFSGAMADRRNTVPDVRDPLAPDVRRAVLTATQGTQYAWQTTGEDGRPGMSAFTAAVVKGLSTGDADADGDGVITINDVYEYVYHEMARAGVQSTPALRSSGTGSMTIVRSRAPHAASTPGGERPGPNELDAGAARLVVMDLQIAQAGDRRKQLEARFQSVFVERIMNEYDVERIGGDPRRDLTLRTSADGAAELLAALANGIVTANQDIEPQDRLQVRAAMYLANEAGFNSEVLNAPELRLPTDANLAVVFSDSLRTAVAHTVTGASWTALRPLTLHVGADRSPVHAWIAAVRTEPAVAGEILGNRHEILNNRYRLIAPIGTGGMAVVWRAQDLALDRNVAVKLLADKPGNSEPFRAVAQVLARLHHPNITAVHDYGEAGDPTANTYGRYGRRPYIVMELLEGELLSNRLRSGPMSWRRATQICAQVAAGLAAAHECNLVHRDIKPGNIMLTAAGAKILDFGVAGLTGSFAPDDEDGTIFGTPAYLAPERLLGGGVIPATDVYTVGLLLYRCLTDRLPWHADTPTQMITNHVYEPPHPLPEIPGLPGDISQLIARCLAKDPAGRPTASEVARVLAAATGLHVELPRPNEPVDGTVMEPARPDGQDIPGYLGRVHDRAGNIVGTCFQARPGVLVTALHIVSDLQPDIVVTALNHHSQPIPAQIAVVDERTDLAVMRCTQAFDASVAGFAATDPIPAGTRVIIDRALLGTEPHTSSYTDDVWATGDGRTAAIPSIMAGAPVRRPGDDLVVGVVVARRFAPRGTARTEDLIPLLDRVEAASETPELAAGLRRALRDGEFALHYQPVVRLADGRVTAVEALLRWTPPGGEAIPPGVFIPVAEATGLIVPIGWWVLEQACAQARAWHARDGISLTVNVAAHQLREPDFVERVRAALHAAGLPARALVLEVTESTLVADADSTARLDALRADGVRVAIDDFGTGYSSLAYLVHLPVDVLKIDRTLIATAVDTTLMRAILQLAGGLSLQTVAEGVETEEQAATLRSLGCEHAQGFLYSRAVPPDDLDALLSGRLELGAETIGPEGTATAAAVRVPSGESQIDLPVHQPGAGSTAEAQDDFEQPIVAPLSPDTDADLWRAVALLRRLDPNGQRTATAVREALDGVIDGPRTGRYSLKQLLKSEKTTVGAQVELAFQRTFGLTDGHRLDLSIDGVEADFKFTQTRGAWQLGPENTGQLVILVYANEELGEWGLALGRVTDDLAAPAKNRDGKFSLRRDRLDSGLIWLFRDKPLQRNVLAELDEEDRQEIFAQASSIDRVVELARRSRGRPISRTALATVVMQADPARRLRDAQPKLAQEGLFLFRGGRVEDRRRIEHLGLPELASDEIVFLQLVSVHPETTTKPFVELAEGFWSLASD
ncbi:NaeI family type II restriction endonuclease [Dactylosporangium sp. NPDC050588]|uniref:NaeI family type II restriction endonuclease n=1 Tax=Dactylosporangium sp. NPDC050588 TaxID=3157211 RepID=UPI0033DFCB2B